MSFIQTVPDLVTLTRLKWIEREEKRRNDPNSMLNSGIFTTENFEDNTGNSRKFTSLDTELYADVTDVGSAPSEMRVQQGYDKTMNMVYITKDVTFTWHDMHQAQPSDIISKIEQMSDLAPRRIELMLAHHFSFCTATSYTNKEGKTVDVSMGDGYAMAYSAHTNKGSSSTYRTILAGNPQLSRGCLEGLKNLFRTESQNELGENLGTIAQPDTLLMTNDANTVNTALILNNSIADPSQSNSGVNNPLKGRYRLIFNDNIGTDKNGNVDSDKDKYVFMIDSKKMRGAARFYVQRAPTILPPSDPENDTTRRDRVIMGVRADVGSIVVDAKGVRMTKGDGSA